VLGLGFFSLFFFLSSFGWASSYQLLWKTQIFWTLWIFFMPPNFVEAPLIIENFFCTCPPVWGCDPSQGSFQKNVTRLKRRLQRIYLNLVKGLIEFSKLVCLDKHHYSLCLVLWIPQNPCEHVRSCMVLKTQRRFLGAMVSWVKCVIV
jgi:hypothetical protein